MISKVFETPLDRYEYFAMKLNDIPNEFRQQYSLNAKAKGGKVFMEIRKGMYGLPAAGRLANKLLKQRLAKKRYYEIPHTPGLFKHVTRPIVFALIVSDRIDDMVGMLLADISFAKVVDN